MKNSTQYNSKLFLAMMLFMAILSFLVGCEEPSTPDKVIKYELLNRNDQIVKIRNCEYITSRVYYGYVYTHLGDCSNDRHYIFKR